MSLGEPPNQRLVPLYTTDLPEVHNVIRGLRQVIDEFPERLLIGEVYLPLNRLVAYTATILGKRICHSIFPSWKRGGTRVILPSLLIATKRHCLRVAGQIGSWQSRSTSHRDASWFRAGPHRSHAAADIARYPYNLLRR